MKSARENGNGKAHAANARTKVRVRALISAWNLNFARVRASEGDYEIGDTMTESAGQRVNGSAGQWANGPARQRVSEPGQRGQRFNGVSGSPGQWISVDPLGG
jgi:hypothetical protein